MKLNKRALWGRAFYNAFHKESAQRNMNNLTEYAESKGMDMFDYKTLEKSLENQENINEMLLHDLVNMIKEQYDLTSAFKVSAVFRDREDHNASIEKENSEDAEYIIFMDDILDSCIFSLIVSLIYWNENKDDHGICEKCFRYMIFVLTEYGEKRTRPATPVWVHDMEIEMLAYSDKITPILTDAQLIIITFIMAHEIGHAVMGHHSSLGRNIEDEYAADDFAYRVILSMIEKQSLAILEKGERPEIDMYSDYTYLVPLMFFDFMQLIEDFRNCVYDNYCWENATKELAARKIHLEAWVYDSPDDYTFDTSEGNKLYNAVLNSIERFTDEMKRKLRQGESFVPET